MRLHFLLIVDCSSMAAADLVQGATIAMSCPFQPKYVGTFRKVDAGMVIVAGGCLTFSSSWGKIALVWTLVPRLISSIARYLHVPQPEVGETVSSRRGSVPAVSSSHVVYPPVDRRGSEPALLQAGAMSGQECGRAVTSSANPQNEVEHPAENNQEQQTLGKGCLFNFFR